jgi:hypothetical protein
MAEHSSFRSCAAGGIPHSRQETCDRVPRAASTTSTGRAASAPALTVQYRTGKSHSWVDVDRSRVRVRHPARHPDRSANDHRSWQLLLDAAGVRRARLHDARHTAATLLLAQGVPARVAMQILGHSQITLTLGTYSHVVPELAQEAADRMADALWPPTSAPMAATLAANPEKVDQDDPVVPRLTCDDVVGRLGIEPRTRGLKVPARCVYSRSLRHAHAQSASFCVPAHVTGPSRTLS